MCLSFIYIRIGAVHSIVFGGYSADSLAARILDAGARVLITADGVYRGTKLIKLLEIAHHAMDKVGTGNCAAVALCYRYCAAMIDHPGIAA